MSRQGGAVFFMRGLAEGLSLTAAAAFIFYRSPAALLLAAVIIPFYLIRRHKREEKRQRNILCNDFKAAMQMVASALCAGYSMENALINTEREFYALYGKDSVFSAELRKMNQRISVSVPVEEVIRDFAVRSRIEDISNFAEVFLYAKRSGGNLPEIIRSTLERMQEKSDILADIENAVASKRAEQRLMMLMLPGVLLFITLSAPEYAACLYHSLIGRLAMTVCMIGYAAAWIWSEKITDIEV